MRYQAALRSDVAGGLGEWAVLGKGVGLWRPSDRIAGFAVVSGSKLLAGRTCDPQTPSLMRNQAALRADRRRALRNARHEGKCGIPRG